MTIFEYNTQARIMEKLAVSTTNSQPEKPARRLENGLLWVVKVLLCVLSVTGALHA